MFWSTIIYHHLNSYGCVETNWHPLILSIFTNEQYSDAKVHIHVHTNVIYADVYIHMHWRHSKVVLIGHSKYHIWRLNFVFWKWNILQQNVRKCYFIFTHDTQENAAESGHWSICSLKMVLSRCRNYGIFWQIWPHLPHLDNGISSGFFLL